MHVIDNFSIIGVIRIMQAFTSILERIFLKTIAVGNHHNIPREYVIIVKVVKIMIKFS